MIPTQVQLFSYTDLPLVAPWLTEKICLSLMAAGLFAPRLTQRAPDADVPYFSLYDLIALTSRPAVTSIRDSLGCVTNSPPCSVELPLRRHVRGRTRFFEHRRTPRTRTISVLGGKPRGGNDLVRHFLEGSTDIEFIPNDLLGAKDFRGITLTGVECKAIRGRHQVQY